MVATDEDRKENQNQKAAGKKKVVSKPTQEEETEAGGMLEMLKKIEIKFFELYELRLKVNKGLGKKE